MRYDELKKISDSIDPIYNRCIKFVVRTAMVNEYGDEEKAWQAFLNIDEENRKAPGGHPISNFKINGFDDFDVPASTKTLLFLQKVRSIVIKEYDLTEKFSDKKFEEKFESKLRDLIDSRNAKSHPKDSIEKSITEDDLSTGISSMLFVIDNLFPNLVDESDPDKRTFYDLLNSKRTEYYNETGRKKYYLEDVINLEIYDDSNFKAVCFDYRIEGDKDDETDKYFFYSSNIESTKKILQNNLKKIKTAPAVKPPVSVNNAVKPIKVISPVQYAKSVRPKSNSDTAQKNKKKPDKRLIVSIALAVAALLIVLIVLLSSCGDKKDGDVSGDPVGGIQTENTEGPTANNEPTGTTAPEATTAPETTKTPETATKAPETTTKAPETTTKAPETTKAPTTTKTTTTKATTTSHKHNYSGTVTKAATCTAAGVKTYKCSCGDSYTENIKATGHSWSKWKEVVAPTTSSEGTSQRECSKCGKIESKSIAKLTTEAPKTNLSFYNYDINGRWNENAITVVPAEVYLENGKWILNCYVVNGFSYNIWNAYVTEITLTDKNGTVFAKGTFSADNQYFSLGARSWIKHTYTFSGDAVITTNVDVSSLNCKSYAKYNY